MVRVDSQCRLELLDRVIDAALFPDSPAEPIVCVGMVRIDSQRRLVLMNRFLGAALVTVDVAQVVMRFGVVRIDPQCSLEHADRLIGAALFRERIVTADVISRCTRARSSTKCLKNERIAKVDVIAGFDEGSLLRKIVLLLNRSICAAF